MSAAVTLPARGIGGLRPGPAEHWDGPSVTAGFRIRSRLGKLRGALGWLALVVVLGIAATAAWLIGDLQNVADARRRTQLTVAEIERLVSQLRYLEAETHNGASIELSQASLAPMWAELERSLDELDRLDHKGDVSFQIREATEQYVSNLRIYFDLEASDPDGAHEWSHERTHPSYQLFLEAVAQAEVFYTVQAQHALERASLGSKLTIALEAVLILLLALAVHWTRRRDERRLADLKTKSEAQFSSLVKNSADVLALLDGNGSIRYMSDSLRRVLGYRPRDLVGRRIWEPVHREDLARMGVRFREVLASPGKLVTDEARVQRSDRSWTWVEVSASNHLSDPHIEGIVVNFRDISARKDMEQNLRRQALHDPLTRLPNRALFFSLLDQALAEQRRNPGWLAVCYVDLDGFKAINDGLGHQAGDEVLKAVAERLRSVLRAEDVAARLGGDEFAVLLKGADRPTAESIGQRILETIHDPLRIAGQPASIGASVGIALAAGGPQGADELLQCADQAMYEAKSHGKGTLRVYRPGMGEAPAGSDPSADRHSPVTWNLPLLHAVAGGKS